MPHWAAARDAAAKRKGQTTQYNAAYAAAKPILDEVIGETAHELRDEAFALFDRMIDVQIAVTAA